MSQIECAITDFDGLLTATPPFDKHDVTLLTRLGLKSPDLDLSVVTSLGQVTLRHNVVVSVRFTFTLSTSRNITKQKPGPATFAPIGEWRNGSPKKNGTGMNLFFRLPK